MNDGRELLLQWIQRSRLQKQEAAALLGVSKSDIRKYIGGDRRPTLDIAVRIEAATGVPVVAWVPRRAIKAAKASRRPRQTRNVSRMAIAHAQS
jgi:plasmid maintenance system antidote protein VapI